MQNYLTNDILNAREHRSQVIQAFVSEFPTVVALKANIPGLDKRFFLAILIISYFEKKLDKLPYLKKQTVDSDDGKAILYAFDRDAKDLKQRMIEWEESYPYGRFVDIDVFDAIVSLNREHPRKCYLCGNRAFDCSRTKRHSTESLLSYMETETLNTTTQLMLPLIKEAMMKELNLHPKFGLVTPQSNGSHNDMDYHLMIRAQEAILPFFVTMMKAAWNSSNEESLFTIARTIGVEAEDAMMESTGGVNCYKGLIFNVGFVVIAFMWGIKHKEILLSTTIRKLATPLEKELTHPLITSGGARKEALEGYPTVKAMMKLLVDDSNESYYRALRYAIVHSDDTILTKRSKTVEKRNEVIQRFESLTDFSKSEIQALTDWCVAHSQSFGGSADLLVTALLIRSIKQTWSIEDFIDF